MERIRKVKKETVIEVLFLFFLFCFYMMWARIQPLDASPDEKMRYRIVEYIFQNGRLPHGDDPAIRDAVWGISYAYNPILDYIFAAGLMKVVALISTKPFAMLMAARLVSIICGLGTGFFAIRISKKVFPESRKGWLFVTLVTLMPGATFVATYVNSDALAILSTSIIVYTWICGMEKGWSYKSCTGLAVGVSLCALSYYNAYGFILCSIFLFGTTLLIVSSSKQDYREFLKKGFFVTGLILVMAGWWFLRNVLIYDGDFLGRSTSSMNAQMYAIEGYRPSDMPTPQRAGMTMWEMVVYGFKDLGISWFELVCRSFIGRFGSLNVSIPAWFENVYLTFLSAGCVLVLIHPVKTFAVRREREWRMEGIFHWSMLVAMIIPTILNMYYSYTSDYQPQGRYSLPMLIPLMYFVVTGYGYLLDKAVKNERTREIIYVIASILIIVGCIYIYLDVFWPEYVEIPFGVRALISGAG